MGLTGLEIYKLLPKKNCGECGPPTCLAFAMALAGSKTTLDLCPYVSEQARATLEGASAPPMRLVTMGEGERAVSVGDETVLFRHDKTFFHETGVAVRIAAEGRDDEIDTRAASIRDLAFERVGQKIGVNLACVSAGPGVGASRFAGVVERVSRTTGMPIVLMAHDAGLMSAGLGACVTARPLVYAADEDNLDAFLELARTKGVPLALRSRTGLPGLAGLAEKAAAAGLRDLLLDPFGGDAGLSATLAGLTHLRRLAIRKKFRPFGYPTIVVASSGDPCGAVMGAGVFVCKYGSVVVVDFEQAWQILPLLTLRQNIFTDPQKPIQVEPKIYEIGDPRPTSPVYVTSNFSLTYFTVEGDVEASRMPGYIVVVDTEGTSVLTSYAAGKFTAEKVAEVLGSSGIADRVSHRRVVIPGYVAAISGKLEEKSGWNVVVGPRESAGIPAFIKSRWAV